MIIIISLQWSSWSRYNDHHYLAKNVPDYHTTLASLCSYNVSHYIITVTVITSLQLGHHDVRYNLVAASVIIFYNDHQGLATESLHYLTTASSPKSCTACIHFATRYKIYFATSSVIIRYIVRCNVAKHSDRMSVNSFQQWTPSPQLN